jgi:frataxin
MSAPRSVRCLRQAVRSLSTRPVAPRYLPRQAPCALQVATRYFSNASRAYKGILPDTDEPKLKEREPLHEVNDPTPIEIDEYHERADQYLEELVSRAEELAEEKEGVDVEYSVSTALAISLASADQPQRPASSTSSSLLTAPTLSTSSPQPSKSG